MVRKLLTGLMDINGIVSVSDSHHNHHLDDRSYGDRVNEEGDIILAPIRGVKLAHLSYRSTHAGDDAPAAAAYAPASSYGK